MSSVEAFNFALNPFIELHCTRIRFLNGALPLKLSDKRRCLQMALIKSEAYPVYKRRPIKPAGDVTETGVVFKQPSDGRAKRQRGVGEASRGGGKVPPKFPDAGRGSGTSRRPE
ncbi:hypothetical protein EVAR_65437_1 [Eumeta japonica]|uniref:Uncharacterized protein n=1 Tax=Eumeta variegata TaxID=151549 RepID=A0A4C1ZAP7_EUMVA|nr:hypothetical protein EVAR_65437_1 [Eumeta japonica]